jgi:GTP-binding protein EngB required for normal cell division/uncharacterized membrane protein
MKQQKINIAISGGTNVGKTTLIRTLMKAAIGEVRDAANVTKRGQAYQFDSLQAIFTDTPGFQNASDLDIYLDELDEDPTCKMSQKRQERLAYDLEAIKALENIDAVIYVASLAEVPNDSHGAEISLVKRKCSKIVAVINQYQQQYKATNKSAVENRIEQWKELFKEHSIITVVVFDAHWDNPIKIDRIYNGILDILEPEKNSVFIEGINRFTKRQSEISLEACDQFAFLIKDCQEKAVSSVSKGDYKNNLKKEEVKEKIARSVNSSIAAFLYSVSALYKVAAEHPTISTDELLLLTKPTSNIPGRITTGSGAATIFGGVGAIVGGLLGSAIMGISTGGVGTIAGATGGAQIGGAFGAAFGSLFVFVDDGDTVISTITEEQIKALSIECIALIWGLSNNGYGRERELSSEERQEIELKVCEAQSSYPEIKFTKSNQTDIAKYCKKILDSIEKREIKSS